MKRLALIAIMLAAGCEKTPSKLEGNVKGAGGGGGEDTAQIEAALAGIEERLAALEASHKAGPGTGAQGDAALNERLAKIEANLTRREEALGFLEMAYAQQKRQQEAKDAGEPDPNAVFAVDISKPLAAGQVEGPNTALVTIVEAWDFAWPHCQRVGPILEELVNEYSGKVRVVYMNMVVHPDAVQMAHQYGCAAAKQKKFVEYKHAFWEKGFGPYAQSGGKDRSALGEGNILQFAGELGLDTQKLKADANSSECKQRVDEDEAELRKFHVNGTPGFFINGKHIGGGIPKEAFKQIIEEKLAIAEKSGVGGAEYYEKEIMGKGVHQFRSKKDAGKGTP